MAVLSNEPIEYPIPVEDEEPVVNVADYLLSLGFDLEDALRLTFRAVLKNSYLPIDDIHEALEEAGYKPDLITVES